jgi:hypothetical protein
MAETPSGFGGISVTGGISVVGSVIDFSVWVSVKLRLKEFGVGFGPSSEGIWRGFDSGRSGCPREGFSIDPRTNGPDDLTRLPGRFSIRLR